VGATGRAKPLVNGQGNKGIIIIIIIIIINRFI